MHATNSSLSFLRSFVVPFHVPFFLRRRRTTTCWRGCPCGITTWAALQSTTKRCFGSTELCCKRSGTRTLDTLMSRPVCAQPVHGCRPQVNLGRSWSSTSSTSMSGPSWSVGRWRMKLAGLALGGHPGIKAPTHKARFDVSFVCWSGACSFAIPCRLCLAALTYTVLDCSVGHNVDCRYLCPPAVAAGFASRYKHKRTSPLCGSGSSQR